MMTQTTDFCERRRVSGEEYVSYVRVADDMGKEKTVIRTVERAAFMTLHTADGRTYGEVSNISEPYDFTTHVFYLPKGAWNAPVTLRFQNRSKKSQYFFAMWEEGETEVVPSRIEYVKRDKWIPLCDNGVVVRDVTEETVAPGIVAREMRCENKAGAPVLMYALFVEHGKGGFVTGTANDGYAAHTDIETVKGQAEASIRNGRAVVAATNADFFDMFGDNAPAGVCIKDGRAIANGKGLGNFFGETLDGAPVIGNFGDNPALYGQLRTAVGGREIFLVDGELYDLSVCEPFSEICHPRTAVGMDDAGNVVVLVVDGRIPVRSNGASLVDLGRIMQGFGMTRAINLDGGGSSTFLIRRGDEMVMLNRPADLHRPEEPLIRPIYNSLQIVKR